MLRYIVAVLCGISLSGSVYMAGWGTQTPSSVEECCVVAPTAASINIPDGMIDIKNTKCIVEIEDIEASTKFVSYQGKAYRICCGDCVAVFNKDPEKYVKLFEADPAKYGVQK